MPVSVSFVAVGGTNAYNNKKCDSASGVSVSVVGRRPCVARVRVCLCTGCFHGVTFVAANTEAKADVNAPLRAAGTSGESLVGTLFCFCFPAARVFVASCSVTEWREGEPRTDTYGTLREASGSDDDG